MTKSFRSIFKSFLNLLRKTTVGIIASVLLPAAVFAVTTIGLNISTDGNTTLGDDATADTVTLNARFASNVSPSTNNARDLGGFGIAWKDIYASSSLRVGDGAASSTISSSGNITFSGHLLPGGNNASDLGAFGTALRNVFASSSIRVGGTSASSTLSDSGNLTLGNLLQVDGSGTSTFAGSVNPLNNNLSNLGWFGTAFRDVYASGSIKLGKQAATTTLNIASNAASTAKGQGTCVPLRATDGTLLYLSATSSPSAGAPWTVLTLSTASCE